MNMIRQLHIFYTNYLRNNDCYKADISHNIEHVLLSIFHIIKSSDLFNSHL